MITTIQGHLTATNKAHISKMLETGITSAKINRIEYQLQLVDGEYQGTIIKKDRGIGFIGNPLQLSTYKVRFKYY